MVTKIITWWRRWHTAQRYFPLVGAGLLCVLGALLFTHDFWSSGFPYTHDGENHLARFVNYTAALREGQWPPRFAPYMNSQFGFPVFHYNYPLANILAVPGIVLGWHPGTVFAWQVGASTLLFLAAGYALVRTWFSARASRFAVALQAGNTYIWSAIVFRGNIGELWAVSLATALLVWIERAPRTRAGLLVGIALATAFLLSHNVVTVILGAVLAAWALARYPRRWRTWLLLGCCAVALTLWFWLPAVAELPLVVLQGDALAQQAAQHVLSWNQILFSPLQFGFSLPNELDTLGFGLGIASVFVLLLSVSFLVSRPRQLLRRMWGVLLAVLCALFLSSAWSAPLWEAVPLLGIVQFPWRFFTVWVLFGGLLAAGVWSRVPRRWRWVLWIMVVWQWSTMVALRPVDRRMIAAEYYLTFPHTTTTRNENRPRTFLVSALPSWEPHPRVATGAAAWNIAKWQGSRRSYSLTVTQDATIIEPTVFFPGWQVTADGQRIANVFTEQTQGFVAYSLPARDKPYVIRSGFFARTPVRLLAELVSAVAVGGYMLAMGKEMYALWSHRRTPRA